MSTIGRKAESPVKNLGVLATSTSKIRCFRSSCASGIDLEASEFRFVIEDGFKSQILSGLRSLYHSLYISHMTISSNSE